MLDVNDLVKLPQSIKYRIYYDTEEIRMRSLRINAHPATVKILVKSYPHLMMNLFSKYCASLAVTEIATVEQIKYTVKLLLSMAT
jgi:hypothetical protein